MNEFEMKNFNFNINVNVEYDQFEILFKNTLHISRFHPIEDVYLWFCPVDDV